MNRLLVIGFVICTLAMNIVHGEDVIDGYFVINSKISYTLWFGLKPFVAVDNVLDRNYDIYANLPGGSAGLYKMTERNYTVGLSYKF